MSDHRVNVVLNQQQRQLLDDTVAQFPGTSREDVLLQALREYCADHQQEVASAR